MRIFYGWYMAFSALFVLLITNGIIIGGLTVFDESLLNEFGWSRGTLKLRDLITFALAGVLGPFVGGLADRFGVRRLMLVGSALLAGGLLFYPRIGSASHMYAIHASFALVLASAGLVVSVMLVARWFVAKRGTATGIALIGTSLGGVFFPQINAALIENFGWRTSFALLAAFPVLLIVVILLFVRDSPAQVGLQPLGAGDGTTAPSGALTEGMEYVQVLRTPTFWALALAAMMTFYSILGVSAHLFLHLRDLDFSVLAAARGISLLFTMGLVGKFAFGALADVLDRKRVFIINLGIMLLGSLCLASLDARLFWPFLILFGMGWGGLFTMFQVLTIDCFGLKAAGKVLGTITVLNALGGGLGPWVTGVIYDQTGSYRLAFMLVVVLVAVALVAATVVRTQKKPPA